MFSIRKALSLYLLALMLMGLPLAAADRIFVLPRAGSSLVTVLSADDLGVEASIPANSSAFKALLTPTGDKYFILTHNSAEAVIVVDGDTLQVLRRLSFDTGLSDGDLSPNGQNLLLAADKLRVVRLGAEEEVIAEVDVGGGAKQVVVNSVLNQAFVLGSGGKIISVVDLATFEVTNTLTVPFVRSIALTSSEDRLLAITEDSMLQFRTSDQAEIPAIPAAYEIRAGAHLVVVGNSSRAIVRNNGSAPNNTSQLFDLDTRTVKGIGTPGTTGLREVLVLSPTRAYAVVESTQELAEIDLDVTPNASVTPLGLGFSALNLDASPNLSRVYVSSSVDSTVTMVDPATNTVLATITSPVPLQGHAVVFGPSSKPPAAITVNSGNNQFLPPGATTPSALSVTVTDEDGTPLFGVPVLFTASENFGLQFQPGEIVTTNTRGVAAVVITIPPDAAPLEAEHSSAAVSAKESGGQALEQSPPQPSLDEGTVQPILITAATPSGHSAGFVLSIVRAIGVIKISGDYQVTEERTQFPFPFVVLATDKTGKPLAPGTEVRFSPSTANCNATLVPVDLNGFASVTCQADALPPGIGISRDGEIVVQEADNFDPDLPPARFRISTAIGARGITLEKVAGDGQTAPTGTALPIPLTLKLKTFDAIGSYGVGVQIRQKSGPTVLLDPTFQPLLPNFTLPVNVTLGSRAGTVVIEAVVSALNTAKVEFTVHATGGILVRLEKEGDGQAARIGRFLASPLRVRAINESGQLVPFPEVEWSVVSGQASLLTAKDSGGATARVQLGLTPGPIVVQAKIDNLVATFNVTATPPQTTAITPISGDGQTVQAGTISEPLIVEVREIGDLPAFGAIVTYSAPSNVLFHALDEAIEPANPLQLIADANGRTSAKAELLGILPPAESGVPAQTADAVLITVSSGVGFATAFSIDPLGRTPVFEASGISNAATYIGGLVPGSIASVFGEGLSEGVEDTVMAGGVLTFRGLSLKVGSISAPLLTVTRSGMEQINFQVPFGVAPGQATTVEIDNNGSTFSVGGVPVFSSQPGIFEVEGVTAGTIGAVVHPEDFSLVTAEHPAAKGSAVAAFFTGGGLLDPAVATGVLGPNPPALMALPVSVKVDGKEAAISFKGYAPGLLGVYQINFTIPETAACGVRSLTLSVGGADSPASQTAVACP
jgi:uncharacterized protein (TIGR03437 family)